MSLEPTHPPISKTRRGPKCLAKVQSRSFIILNRRTDPVWLISGIIDLGKAQLASRSKYALPTSISPCSDTSVMKWSSVCRGQGPGICMSFYRVD